MAADSVAGSSAPRAWEVEVEAEVLRSTLEQELPVEVDDAATLHRVALILGGEMVVEGTGPAAVAHDRVNCHTDKARPVIDAVAVTDESADPSIVPFERVR